MLAVMRPTGFGAEEREREREIHVPLSPDSNAPVRASIVMAAD
jgi:hypothetical protein